MKKGLLFILSLFFLITSVKSLELTSSHYILYNMNENEVILASNEEDIESIASLTKVVTAIVAIENIDNLEDKVVITANDFANTSGYSKAGFSVGDVVTYEDLLYGVLLPSGAEAVNALVNNTLKDDFVTKMNELVLKLDLKNTSFSNPIGKDEENNYSTAKDFATILKYALKNEVFKKIFTTKKYITSNNLELNSTLNTYEDIFDINIIEGSKSGFTKNAGRCLASISNINNVNYLLVVLNSSLDYPYNALKDSLDIYNYYSSNYSYQDIIDEDTYITTLNVKYSKEKEYEVTGSEVISKYLLNDESSKVIYEYEGIEEIEYNTKINTYLGKVNIYLDDELIATEDVYLEDNIKYYPLEIYFSCFIILVIILLIVLIKRRRKKR